MRRPLVLALVLLIPACARQRVSAPVVTSPGPRVIQAGVAAIVHGSATISGTEAVDYLLAEEMLIPVAGVSVDRLQDTFDEGRSSGRVHRALDILAPRGTPVLAADGGRLIRVSVNALGGNTIYATDPQGRIVFYYAHLDSYQSGLVEGASIARGDTLGFVGTSGNAPKDVPHLHFQVMRMPPDGRYWAGEPINPFPLFLLARPSAIR